MPNSSMLVVRCSITLLFLWFGVQQVIDPQSWVGFLPSWTANLSLSPATIVWLNGVSELFLGSLLGVGLFTRISALLLGIHLLGIAVIAGDAIGVRDAVLALCTLSIAMSQPDSCTLDEKIKKR